MDIMSYLFRLGLLLAICAGELSCTKDEDTDAKDGYLAAVIERNCTGTYLRLENLYYQVCNPEMTEDFANEQAVEVQFEEMECSIPYVCQLYFPRTSSVEVMDIH